MAKEKASQEEIYRVMRADIEAGSYPASTRLPSVRTLAKRFSASPNTISKVVSRLMESGLCTARRGVGLFVRSLPNRKLTLLVGSNYPEPRDDFYGHVERRIQERCQADGIEIERYHITIGAALCGLSVKMNAFARMFPRPNAGGPIKRADFMISEMLQGIEQIKDTEKRYSQM